MFSQPSEISDFRLRREVIIPQSDAQGAAPTLVRNGFARSGVVQCSLSRRKSWISVYGVRLLYYNPPVYTTGFCPSPAASSRRRTFRLVPSASTI